jgi:xylulokinase
MAWDEEAVALICRRDQLPAVVSAGTPIGALSPAVAAMTGLRSGVPICCGTADVLADSVASGAIRPGDTMVMYGSTLFIVHVTDAFQPQPPFWASVYPVGRHHCVVTGTSTAGAAADWWLELAGCREPCNRDAMLAKVANVRAFDDGLVFLPYLRGERAPIFIPSARGVFFGLTTQHTSAHLYRAVLESIGFSLRHVLDEMRLKSRRILVSGGGSDLPLPLQIAVDASGASQLKARRGRSAGYGAAVLAGIGAGAIPPDALSDDFFGGFDVIEPLGASSASEGYALYRKVSAAATTLFGADPVKTSGQT